MVNGYLIRGRVFIASFLVQIPLWSMVTSIRKPNHHPYLCSNSSMVNGYVLYAFDFVNIRHVQIPLWSMVTLRHICVLKSFVKFKFLYGQWLRVFIAISICPLPSSNSSMVNGYVRSSPRSFLIDSVQIPLWSMVTFTSKRSNVRFKNVQIPLWSMVTFGSRPVMSGIALVQIPLWSMVTS
ncbi:MAG: hypothetical protein PWQ82_516 [Thermosediminibacterales bacterium]|nr:hypothetical protein [Thermosediminibacterales bacterium]